MSKHIATKPVTLTNAARIAVAAAARKSTTADTRKVARLAMGVSRLTSEQAAEVDAVARTAWERAALAASTPRHVTLVDRLYAVANKRVCGPLLRAYQACGYRVAGGSWAGGEHSIKVVMARGVQTMPGAASDTQRAWSSNGKWSGMNSSHTLTVRPTWCRDVEARGAAVVDGLLTLSIAAEIEPHIYLATWVEQGRGTGLNTTRGYLVAMGSTWKHADTVAAARRLLRAAPVTPRVAVDVNNLDAAAILRRARCLPHVVLTLHTAPVEGRICAAGVRDWAAKRGIDVDGIVTAGDVARLAAESRDRVAEVLVVLRAAGMRHRANAQAVAPMDLAAVTPQRQRYAGTSQQA